MPYKYGIPFLMKGNFLKVTPQVCGCPCPNALIEEGKLVIPIEFNIKHLNIYNTELNIVNSSILTRFSNIGEYHVLYVRGEIVGFDTIACSERSCELAYRFRIDKEYTKDYVPLILLFNSKAYYVYLIVSIVGLFIVGFIIISKW